MSSAIVLLSGGLDSSTTLAIALREAFDVHALTFSYGQKHEREVEAASAVARALGVKEHKVIQLDLRQIGGSALTDEEMEVPTSRSLEEISEGIPPTYVPARNTVLLSYALSWSEVLGAACIYIGANSIDYSGYPDCRPAFYEAFQEVARLGTKRGVEGKAVEIRYPLISLPKAAIVRKALELGVPLELTWSCYLGRKRACGVCDACQIRLKGFKEAGIEDPIPYERYPEWYP
ncbi:MAG: 7-cyano-7-deazaguanine synthase QueC [Thermoplasmata archaeon]